MSKFKQAIETAAFDLVCLKHARVIVEGDNVFPEWIFLKAEYDANQGSSWQTKALISITNSIITQRRIFFTITRKSFRALSQNDQNWTTPIGLDNNAWKDLINTGIKIGLFKTVKKLKVKGRDRILFELVDKDVLALITIDRKKQEIEALKFIETLDLNEDKPQLTPEKVENAFKELSGDIDELVHTLKQYDYGSSKESLAIMIRDCTLPVEDKRKIGTELNIRPPKKLYK